MANILKQGIIQTEYFSIPPRIVIQYNNDEEGDKQVLIDYDTLDDSDKAAFDSFRELCKSKMV
tara:strand:- start:1012 stop:1200 length:189 start_codon:yes stop_codon:yes gene_type:complete